MVVDDGGEVLGDGHVRDPRLSRCVVVRALHDLGEDRRHEERHAVGALVQGADERFVAGERLRALGHVVRDLGLRERIEHDLLAQPVQAQLVPQRIERVIQRDDLGQAKAREPHEARAAAPPRDMVDEPERRPVAPMQVFGHQQQRPLLGVAIQHLAHLPQHAVRADAGELAPQRVALVCGGEPWQLQQPRRRDGA